MFLRGLRSFLVQICNIYFMSRIKLAEAAVSLLFSWINVSLKSWFSIFVLQIFDLNETCMGMVTSPVWNFQSIARHSTKKRKCKTLLQIRGRLFLSRLQQLLCGFFKELLINKTTYVSYKFKLKKDSLGNLNFSYFFSLFLFQKIHQELIIQFGSKNCVLPFLVKFYRTSLILAKKLNQLPFGCLLFVMVTVFLVKPHSAFELEQLYSLLILDFFKVLMSLIFIFHCIWNGASFARFCYLFGNQI